jgi:U3 small nucleolar RNA-associated protein 10
VQAGVLMIAAQLSNRATLSESLLSSLLRSLAGSPPASLQSESLMVIIQIFQTQRPAAFPPKALKPLAKFPGLADSLADLTARFDTGPFLRPFLKALVSAAPGDGKYEVLLVEIIEKVPIAGEIGALARDLLGLAGFGGSGAAERTAVADWTAVTEGTAVAQRVLRILDKRYSVELDASVNELLKETAAREESDEEDEDSEEDEEPKRGGAKKAAVKGGGDGGSGLFDFMQETFSGGLHAPLAESGASLYLSVDHPQAEVRRLALERLGGLVGEDASQEGEISKWPFPGE